MKRKIFAIVLACLMIFTLLPVSVFAADVHTHAEEDIHEHQFTEEIITPATCTEKGEKKLVCECGYSYIQIIPATGHEFDEGTVDPDSTCTETGVKTFQCKHCDYSYTVQLPAAGHSVDQGTVTKEPTCTENGVKTYRCTVCGEVVYTEEIAALGHHYVAEEFDPSCTEEGKIVYTCDRCGDHYETGTKPVIPHEYEIISQTDATCTEAGSIVYKCKHCDDTYTEIRPAFNHNYQLTSSKPATCTEKGVDTYTCKNCGDTYFVQHAPNGHHYTTSVVFEATCVDDGVMAYTCDGCGKVHTAAIPATAEHHYSETVYTSADGKYTYRTCTMCDDILVVKGWGEIPAAAGVSKRIKATVTITAAVDAKITLTVKADASYENLEKFDTLTLTVNGSAYELTAADFENGILTKEIEFNMVNIANAFTAVLTGTIAGVECSTEAATYTFGKVETWTDDSAKMVELEGATAKMLGAGLGVSETVYLIYQIEATDVTAAADFVLRDLEGNEIARVKLGELTAEDGKYVVRINITAKQWKQVFAATICDANGNAISSTYQFSASAYAARHITKNDLDNKFLEILRAMMAYTPVEE